MYLRPGMGALVQKGTGAQRGALRARHTCAHARMLIHMCFIKERLETGGAMIDKYTEQRIKDTARIVEVVGDYVALRKRGVEYEGLCPFHEDRHLGSFKVSPAKNICTCFSCDKTFDPVGFIMEIENVDYPEALQRLAAKYGIMTDEPMVEYTPRVVEQPKPLEMLTMDRELVRESIKEARYDTLVKWIQSLPWAEERKARIGNALWLYAVGRWRDGRTVFWQIDDKGNIRSGKLMRYQDNGKRVRTENPGWVHSEMSYDKDRYEYQGCLFGMHLLKRYPGIGVHIVESEKTALICSIAYGLDRGLWMACGGLQRLKKEMLAPIMAEGRGIYLWPDRDGADKWKAFARSLRYNKIGIYTEFLAKNWIPEDGEKADIADIIVRRLYMKGESLKERMIKRNPYLGQLIEQLNLSIEE